MQMVFWTWNLNHYAILDMPINASNANPSATDLVPKIVYKFLFRNSIYILKTQLENYIHAQKKQGRNKIIPISTHRLTINGGKPT